MHHSLANLLAAMSFSVNVAVAEPLSPTEGLMEAAPPVGGYVTDTAGNHSVNGYWIEGDDGLILIDTHWRLSDARRALDAMRDVTDAPIRAILLTHPHSDHFGGVPVFWDAAKEAGGTPELHASAWSARSIRHDEQGFRANRRDQFGDDFPAELPAATHTIRDGVPIEVAGVRVVPHVLRQNEAVETVLFHLPGEKALFTGDLVNGRTLPVLYQGGLDAWIDQLRTLRAQFPDVQTIYPGHGVPGSADRLIEEQIAVLEAHRDLIAAALEDDGDVDETERSEIIAEVERRFSEWRTTAGIPSREGVISRNVDWVLRGWRVQDSGETQAREFREDE